MKSSKICFAITRKEGICDQGPSRFYDRISGKFREVAEIGDNTHHFDDDRSAKDALKKVAQQSHGGLMQVVPLVVAA